MIPVSTLFRLHLQRSQRSQRSRYGSFPAVRASSRQRVNLYVSCPGALVRCGTIRGSELTSSFFACAGSGICSGDPALTLELYRLGVIYFVSRNTGQHWKRALAAYFVLTYSCGVFSRHRQWQRRTFCECCLNLER